MSSLTLSSTQLKDQANNAVNDKLGGSVNLFDLPKIKQVSINIGVGRYESKQKQEIAKYLELITGQKPKQVKSRVSISNFKLRKGEINGLVVTLRGQKMYDFLTNLVYISLPRVRDFKGLKNTSFDKNYSCYSLGLSTASIFPQVGFDASVNFGMQINISFNKAGEQNKLMLESLNFPFKKD